MNKNTLKLKRARLSVSIFEISFIFIVIRVLSIFFNKLKLFRVEIKNIKGEHFLALSQGQPLASPPGTGTPDTT